MSTSLSAEEFLERSRTDRDFFFRNAIKIRPKDAKRLIPLVMRPAQRKLMDTIDRIAAQGRAPRIIILKARQIGFSTVTDLEMFRRCLLWPLQLALVTAHVADSAEILFGNIHRAYQHLPQPIRADKRYSAKRLIHLDENDSLLQVQVAKEARGITAQQVHVSELAFVEDAEARALMTAILNTMPDTPESLVIVESTPNGIGNEFHRRYVRAKRGTSEWVAFFVPWFDEPTYRMSTTLTETELAAGTSDAMIRAHELYRTHKLDLDQISWWLYTLENKCNGDLDVMEQEYPSNDRDCFLASGRKVFDRAGLAHYIDMSGLDVEDEETPEQREARERADTRNHSITIGEDYRRARITPDPRGELRIYRQPVHRHRYLIGADLSAGDPGSDHTPVVVLDQNTLSVDAVWYTKAPPEVVADHAAAIAHYYNRGKVIGEANNHGILFHHRLIDELQYPSVRWRRTSEDSVSGTEQDRPGFWTSGANREHLFNLVRRFVRERRGRVEDERMVLEWTMLQYERTPSGAERVDHPDDGASDLTIALAMCLAEHAGGFDGELAPMEASEVRDLLGRYDEYRRLANSGLSTAHIDLSGIPIETLDQMEFDEQARAARSSRGGLR